MPIQKFNADYHIKSYECDHSGRLRLLTLMNIFQDIADAHSTIMGVGIEHCLKNGLAWIGAQYLIEIENMPAWHEDIHICSWPAAEKKVGAVRDFIVTDNLKTPIIKASSLWILIDYNRKRPVCLRDHLPCYQAIEERVLDTDFPRLPDLERCDFMTTFKIRYDDIDVNQHVNNAVYPLWATESVPEDFRLKFQPQRLEVAFKKESLYGENIRVETQIDGLLTLHCILSEKDNRELARIRILWK